MSLKRNMELFSNAPMFAAMSHEQLEMIASEALITEYDQDSVVFNQGDIADSAFVISAGQISLVQKFKAEMREVEVLGVGCTFGEKALVIETTRPVSAIAKTFCALIEVKRPNFLRVMESYPELAILLRNHMLKKLIHIKKDLVHNISKFQKSHTSNEL